MDEGPRPGRRLRWLLRGLAGLGAVGLVWALWGFLRVTVSGRAPGSTAGGATTLAERCSRSVPDDLAAACIEAGQQASAAARLPLALAAAAGVVLIGLSIGVSRLARQPRNRHRRNG